MLTLDVPDVVTEKGCDGIHQHRSLRFMWEALGTRPVAFGCMQEMRGEGKVRMTQEKAGKGATRPLPTSPRSHKKETVARLLTPMQASELFDVPLSYWWGRGKSRSALPGIIRVGRLIRVDPQKFGVSLQDGTPDGVTEHEKEAASIGTFLTPGDYRCRPCGWVGYVSRPVLPEDLCCPSCSTRANVERVG